MDYICGMKVSFALIVFFCFSITAICQNPTDSGFSSKAEAKNKMVNGLKEAKWVEYLDETENVIVDTTKMSDTGIVAKYYRLTVYKAGKPFGIERYYYVLPGANILFREIPYTNGKINGVYKEYYPDGLVHREYPYTNGMENGIAKDYWDGGNVKYETKYTNGKEGATKNYDEDGNEMK
jgi:antitoxin component YwqK of YwqJK toxin-antitoxin module